MIKSKVIKLLRMKKRSLSSKPDLAEHLREKEPVPHFLLP